MGTCDEACSGDAECDLDSKCCSNGCGHDCFKSISKLFDVSLRVCACVCVCACDSVCACMYLDVCKCSCVHGTRRPMSTMAVPSTEPVSTQTNQPTTIPTRMCVRAFYYLNTSVATSSDLMAFELRTVRSIW